MKLHKQKNSVINVDATVRRIHESSVLPSALVRLDLSQMGELIIRLFNDKNLEVSKVRPFFWSLVETYVDRFQLYPFDASKALLNDLELKGYPEDTVLQLVAQLESQYEKAHGRPLRQSTQSPLSHNETQNDIQDDEANKFRASLKYAAMVARVGE